MVDWSKSCKFQMALPNKLIHLKITLPMWKICHKSSTGDVWISHGVDHNTGHLWKDYALCDRFNQGVIQRVGGLQIQLPRKLTHLKDTLPLWKICCKSSTWGVWISNGVAHNTFGVTGNDFPITRVELNKIKELTSLSACLLAGLVA